MEKHCAAEDELKVRVRERKGVQVAAVQLHTVANPMVFRKFDKLLDYPRARYARERRGDQLVTVLDYALSDDESTSDQYVYLHGATWALQTSRKSRAR